MLLFLTLILNVSEAKITECQKQCISNRDVCVKEAKDSEKKKGNCSKKFLACAVKCDL
jgi:hypothetical protein